MEAATALRRLMPGTHAGSPGGKNADIIDFPSQREEGFFDPDGKHAAFDNQVAKAYERTLVSESKYGAINRRTYEMEDGTLYPVLIGVPDNPVSDTAITYTTAWVTSTRGHNKRTLLTVMKHGYPGVMIGPEGEEKNHEKSLVERFHDARNGSLLKVAHDMNRILDHVLEDMDVEDNQVIGIGESRGAMTGFGLGAASHAGDRKLVYGDFTAPCFPRKAQLKEIPGVLLQLLPEAKTLAALGVDLLREPHIKHYPATLHTDPEYYAKELFKVPQLWSGQAGELASEIDPDTPMHIRIFRNDGWSQAEVWQELFANHSNVHLELTDGYHLDIANKSTLHNIAARLDLLAESRGFDGAFSKVDFEPIIKLHAHEDND